MRVVAPTLLPLMLLAACADDSDGGWEADMLKLAEQQKLQCASDVARQEALFHKDATGDKIHCITADYELKKLIQQGPPSEHELQVWRESRAWEKEYEAALHAANARLEKQELELTERCEQIHPNRWTPESKRPSTGDALADSRVFIQQMEAKTAFDSCVGYGKLELERVGDLADAEMAERGITLEDDAFDGAERFGVPAFRSLFARYEASADGN